MTEESLDFNATLKIDPNALSVDMDGDVVTMNLTDNQFYGVNDIGTLIWRTIEEHEMSVSELYQSLTERFKDDDPEQIKQELTAFLLSCRDKGVLVIE